MIRTVTLAAAAASSLTAAAAQDERNAAIDLSVGTTGLSAHAQVGLGSRLAVRLGYAWLDYSADDETYDDVTYDGELEMSGFGGYADVHPFANAFTLSGGVMVGDKSVSLVATPNEAVEIGGQTFAPDQLGSLTGEGDFGNTAFFAGLGYDPSLYKDGRVSLIVRAGVMFAGEPDVALDASVLGDPALPAEARTELRAALDREEAALEDDIDQYGYWPVLTVGLGYSF